MKTIIKQIVLLIIICLNSAIAMGQSGIYMTVNDYQQHKLTYENRRIHLHTFFGNSPGISISDQGKKITLQKEAVYGYRDKKNADYRFYKNVAYRIAEAGHLYIYVLQQNVAQDKGFKVVNEYYFSTSATGNIVPLTPGNLKAAYRNNSKFTDLLDMYFGDGNVAAYDELHKTYKVNYVFSKTLNK